MQLRFVFLVMISALFAFSAVPGESYARGKKAAAAKKKSKKKKSKKKEAAPQEEDAGAQVESADLVDDPWADESPPEEEPEAKPEPEPVEDENPETDQPSIAPTSQEGGALRRSSRMEFDERLVKGQAAKSGAVYLFKRVPRTLPGLVPMRRSYRGRIVEPVLGDRELKPAIHSGRRDAKSLEETKTSEETTEQVQPKEQRDPKAQPDETEPPKTKKKGENK